MFDILNDRQFLQGLEAIAKTAEETIEAYSGGFDITKEAIKERRHQILTSTLTAESIEFFGRTYFPHYIRKDKDNKDIPLSLFQSRLLRTLASILNGKDSFTECFVAPRGEAKSTWCFIFVMLCIVRCAKRFILYVMDAIHQAAPVIVSIQAELEFNHRLKVDFPSCFGVGISWKAGEIITKNSIKVQAFGTNTKMRGIKHGAFRPDMVILDDIENDENVRSPHFRDNLEHWLNASVLGLGEAGEKCDILYPGTILHTDSVLVRTMNNPAWHTTICKSILSYPLNMDLWERWEEIYRSHSKKQAFTFYQHNKQAMDKGAIVSWAQKRSLLLLMELRVKIGTRAFLSEQQGEPQPRDAIFTNFTYWVEPKKWTYFGVCDPSLGKAGQGRDPSAILIGGIHKQSDTFILDIIEAKITKRTPSRLIEEIIELQQKYTCVKWGIESVQFQEFFRTQLMAISHKRGIPINALPIASSKDKVMRIESLESPVRDGLIRFASNQTVLLEQLRQFPEHIHDDGPDALEMLYTLVSKTHNTLSLSDIRRTGFNLKRHVKQTLFSHLGKPWL